MSEEFCQFQWGMHKALSHLCTLCWETTRKFAGPQLD
jgi:hypothetical protein